MQTLPFWYNKTMDVQQYIELTGVSVATNRQQFVYSQIQYTQAILEDLLGYTLNPELVEDNEYTETGKLDDTCPCACGDVDEESLEDPDPVIFAYRLYTYHSRDKYLAMDPCTSVHAVKLVKDGVTYRTLDSDEYRVDYKRGIVKFVEQCDIWCRCRLDCDCVQLAVDADWLWPEDEDGNATFPADLLNIWAQMVTYYSDLKRDVRSETLGPHSYTRFDRQKPEELSANFNIIKRYAGPNGTAIRMPV